MIKPIGDPFRRAFRSLPIRACGLALASVPTAPAIGSGQAAEPAIEWAAAPTNSQYSACAVGAAVVAVCRLQAMPRFVAARQWLDAVTADSSGARVAVQRAGDTLYLVYEGDAERVDAIGSVAAPLSRWRGTRLWAGAFLLEVLDEARVEFGVSTTLAQRQRILGTVSYIGPRAPALVPLARTLAGTIVHDTLRSEHLASSREVTVYVPPARGNTRIAAVVYAMDGSSVSELSRAIDTRIVRGELPRVLLVGVHADKSPPVDDDYPARTLEYIAPTYLPDVKAKQRYDAHERFVLDEVIPWAERRFGAPSSRESRVLFGFSNGGIWAIETALRYPRRFGAALAFSPGGGRRPPPPAPRAAPQFRLTGGRYEPAFLRQATVWRDSLRAAGYQTALQVFSAGHDFEGQWLQAFPAELRAVLPGKRR